MKKIYIILFLFIIISLSSIMHVKAATGLGLCNIGFGKSNSKGYGYYTVTPFEPKPGTVRDLSGYRSNTSDCGLGSLGWCSELTYSINMSGDLANTGSKITDYTIYFLNDDGERLCEITPDNGGFGLDPSSAGISTVFNLSHGHVSKIEVAYTYLDEDGKSKRNPSKENQYKSFSVKKKVGDTGSVSNPTVKLTTTTKAATAVEGYYMCNTTTLISSSNTQECVKKKNGDLLTNCEKKRFTSLNECKIVLSKTSVTTTTGVKKTTVETAGTISGAGEQAGLVQGSAPDDSYNPSNSNVKCNDISTIVDKYWKYVTILVPIGLILLIIFDFIKAITSSNDEQLKKSVSAALKRTIATVILLMLPILLDILLGWFGLDLCL